MVAVDDTQLSWQAVRFTLEELYRDGECMSAAWVGERCMLAGGMASFLLA